VPRLHRYAESTKFNFYDAFLYSHDPHTEETLAVASSIRLFGNANCGIAEKSNTQVPGLLVSD
jgi:hypothetical protein